MRGCVISTRLSVADIADHDRSSALRLDLEHLSSEAGAKLSVLSVLRETMQSCGEPVTNLTAIVWL